jgi:hypothetical protein
MVTAKTTAIEFVSTVILPRGPDVLRIELINFAITLLVISFFATPAATEKLRPVLLLEVRLNAREPEMASM